MLRKPYTMISLRGSAFASSLSIRCDHHTQLSTSAFHLLDHSTLKEDSHCDCYSNSYYSRDNLSDLDNVTNLDGIYCATCRSRNISPVLPTLSTFHLNLEFELEREITKTAAEWGRRWSAWIPRCLHDEKAECKDVISHRMHLHLPSCWRRCF